MIIRRLMIVLCSVLFSNLSYAWLFSSSDFNPGECVKAQDGFIWKISRIEDGQYVLQGWFDKWGNETKMGSDIISKDRGHHKIECPVYTIQPQKSSQDSVPEIYAGCMDGAKKTARNKAFKITYDQINSKCLDIISKMGTSATEEQLRYIFSQPYQAGCNRGVFFIYEKVHGEAKDINGKRALLKEAQKTCGQFL